MFDFIRALLESLEADMTRVVLDDVHGRGIGSTMYVRRADGEIAVPCYPPDAIALAVRAGVPIYATAEALRQARPVPPPMPDTRDVGSWVDGVKPGDFR